MIFYFWGMNQSPFFIYPIEITDLEKLRHLAIQTFEETFASTNSPENMHVYYRRSFNRKKLERELKDERSRFWFIDYEGLLAGYLKVNTGGAQTEMQEEEGFEVERIYILRKFYGTGVGYALMEHAINYGRSLDKKYLWLGVHEENYRAMKFYEKFGMKQFDDHVFMMGDQPQRDVLLKRSL